MTAFDNDKKRWEKILAKIKVILKPYNKYKQRQYSKDNKKQPQFGIKRLQVE